MSSASGYPVTRIRAARARGQGGAGTRTPGPSTSQPAPGAPKGIPTLPAFTTRTGPTVRSNGMWVCPHTTTGTPSPAKTGRRRASGGGG